MAEHEFERQRSIDTRKKSYWKLQIFGPTKDLLGLCQQNSFAPALLIKSFKLLFSEACLSLLPPLKALWKSFGSGKGLAVELLLSLHQYLLFFPGELIHFFCWRRASGLAHLIFYSILNSLAKISAGSCREWRQGCSLGTSHRECKFPSVYWGRKMH